MKSELQARRDINRRTQFYFVRTSRCATLVCGVTRSMRSQKPLHESRAAERGAALITAVLLSLLLLAAGGTLILTATMTSITARDSTAEMQAYYAAEAGVARALEVVRGNVQSSPAGTRATFANIVCSKTLWTITSGNSVNVASDGSTSLQVSSIVDPDNTAANPCSNAP